MIITDFVAQQSINTNFPQKRKFPSILNDMRMIFTMASLLIVSLLVFNGYSNGVGNNIDAHAGERPMTPINQAKDVNRLIQDAAIAQQQAIENQIQ